MKTQALLNLDGAYMCPGCRGECIDGAESKVCLACARVFRDVAGMPDLRLESDRYLDIEAERAKAGRLHALEGTSDLRALAEAYYAITDDVVDDRRDRFLRHIAMAEARGEALLSRLPEAGRILDVGCGTGGLLVAAVRAGRSIVGVDIASRWLVVARRRLSDHGLATTLVAASAECLPWADESFDIVVADSLLEHLDDPVAALREWLRVLRPGGRLVLWSPNRGMLTTDPHVGLWGVGWLPRAWVPTYLRLRKRHVWPPRTLSAHEAGRLARAVGFDFVQVDPAPIPECWARRLSGRAQLASRLYSGLLRFGLTRSLLRVFGPLWELHATKREGGSA